MVQVKVKDAALREAAMQDMDAFLAVFVNATKEAIGGELNAENMQQLSVSQITLLAYDILHEEVMDGGFVQLIYNGYGGFIFDNPFAKVLRDWGLRDLAKMLFAVRKLYKEHGAKICRECDDEEFMAMFEQYSDFDDLRYRRAERYFRSRIGNPQCGKGCGWNGQREHGKQRFVCTFCRTAGGHGPDARSHAGRHAVDRRTGSRGQGDTESRI